MIMKESINRINNEIIKRQEAIETLSLTKKANMDVANDLSNQIDAIKVKNLKEILGDLPEDIVITHSDGRFEFNKDNTRSRGLSGMFTLYSRKCYGNESFEKGINYYTCLCETESEMERLVLLGKLAEKVVAISDKDLFEMTSKGTQELEEQRNAFMKKRWNADDMMNKLQREISDLKRDTVEIQLMSNEGIKVDDEKDGAFLQVGNDKIYASQAISVRIKEKSASGKTATVEVVSLHTFYDSETDKYVSKPFESNYPRVKMDQLLYGVRNFLERVEEKKERRLKIEQEEKELANTAS